MSNDTVTYAENGKLILLLHRRSAKTNGGRDRQSRIPEGALVRPLDVTETHRQIPATRAN